MTQGGVTTRWSLLRSLLLLILLLSASILTVLLLTTRRTIEEVVRRFASSLAARAEAEIGEFLGPVSEQLRMVGRWAENGTLLCRDASCLDPLLRPVLEQLRPVSAISTGDAAGAGVTLLQVPGGWLLREVDRESWERRARFTALGADGRATRTWWEDSDYDPRTRPWYAEARPDAVRWTAPYTFFTTGRPGMTASLQVRGPDGEPWVVAFDLLLEDLAAFTTGLEVSPRGIALVVDDLGRVVGPPRRVAADGNASPAADVLTPVREVQLAVVQDLSRAVLAREVSVRTPFAFESGGEEWWGEWRPIGIDADTRLFVGIAVPFEDFLGTARRNRWIVAGLSIVALLAAALVATRLARRFAIPLEDLIARSDRIRRLDTRPEPSPASKVLEVRRLYEAQERMRQAIDSFARYVPTDVVRDLLERGEAARIGGRLVQATVLFTDVQGFTALAERMSPQELVAHMSEYFDAMVTTLRDGGATIDKLVGDAIVAFWGAPQDDALHAQHAVAAVLACRRRVAELNAGWQGSGRPALPTRFGLATGPVVVGNVGAPSRLHYTALGDTMNLASRLEGANTLYGTTVLAPRATVEAAGPTYAWRHVDVVTVKGREQAVEVYDLQGSRDEIDAPGLRAIEDYERALGAFRSGRCREALDLLAGLAPDPAARALADRCRAAEVQGAALAPDSVRHLTHKREDEP